jgi:REP element-mobilizing transposase RayT
VPRRHRIDVPGAIHHVVASGNGGCKIVEDGTDRTSLIERLSHVAYHCGWRVHAYCLMDTHVHAVIETPQANLGVGMQRLVGGHAFRFNRHHRRSGHLFAGPYYSAEITGEAHLIEAGIYVVLNPVRAGLVVHARDWPWSSYQAVTGIAPTPSWLATDVLPNAFASDPGTARAIYEAVVEEVALRPPKGSG